MSGLGPRGDTRDSRALLDSPRQRVWQAAANRSSPANSLDCLVWWVIRLAEDSHHLWRDKNYSYRKFREWRA